MKGVLLKTCIAHSYSDVLTYLTDLSYAQILHIIEICILLIPYHSSILFLINCIRVALERISRATYMNCTLYS
jgi:hypothetical protein